MECFDLLIIGGGPAGYLAAERSAEGGLTVAVIEKRAVGGVCLNEGCIPSKALLHSGKVYEYALHGDKYGVTVENASIDQSKVIDRKNKVVKVLVTGIKSKLKKCGVTLIEGEGVIQGKTENGFAVLVNGETYYGKKLLLATGSVPMVPPIQGLSESLASGFALTNREILDLREIPGKLVVVGGGVIGLEMAAYYNSVGSEVTVIEMLQKIAGPTDGEISAILQKNYQKKGVSFCLGCKVTAIENGKVTYEEQGETKEIAADKVLISIGRKAQSEHLGLETIGVETLKGAVPTDLFGRTNVEGVYAAGDLNGKSLLAHTAYREAEVAVSHMLGIEDPLSYCAIPSVIYTNPEVAMVGETEETAKEKGMDVSAVTVPMRLSGRYIAEVEGGDGICKLVMDNETKALVGVHLIGSYVSEIIYGAALMITQKTPIEDIKKVVFPHPSVCEVLREATFML